MHPLWFYKNQHDNRVRSKLSVACQRWWFQWRFWFVPSVPGYLREEEEHKPDPWRNPIERNHTGVASGERGGKLLKPRQSFRITLYFWSWSPISAILCRHKTTNGGQSVTLRPISCKSVPCEEIYIEHKKLRKRVTFFARFEVLGMVWLRFTTFVICSRDVWLVSGDNNNIIFF